MTDDQPAPKPHIAAAEIEDTPAMHFTHPFNPKAGSHVKYLSPIAGLTRTVLALARIPPGKESFAKHTHERDEEFIYILSGRGQAAIGDDLVEVGPGDFLGFPAPGAPAHNLRNPYDEDLVYLMGGERSGFDIAHFPDQARRIAFTSSGVWQVEDQHAKPMAYTDWLANDDA